MIRLLAPVLLVACAVLPFSRPGLAAKRAGILLEFCKTGDGERAVVCVQAVDEYLRFLRGFQAGTGFQPPACVPPGTTLSDAIEAVTSWVWAQPERAGLDSPDAIVAALRWRYRCQRPTG